MRNNIKIVEYCPKYSSRYKELNREWISKYFEINDHDEEILSHPERIIENDGYILCAVNKEKIIGTCNLEKIDDSTYELSKLCVTESVQGNGIGEMLIDATINRAKQLKIQKIHLLTSKILNAAFSLYVKKGFYCIDKTLTPLNVLNRNCEIAMVLDLNQNKNKE